MIPLIHAPLLTSNITLFIIPIQTTPPLVMRELPYSSMYPSNLPNNENN